MIKFLPVSINCPDIINLLKFWSDITFIFEPPEKLHVNIPSISLKPLLFESCHSFNSPDVFVDIGISSVKKFTKSIKCEILQPIPILLLEKTILIFKNLWQEKNDIDLAYTTYKDKALFIRDLVIPHYNISDFTINNTIDNLLFNDEDYFRESCSSVITAIIFAKYLGFKKIVLHGIDFHGDYFFDQVNYVKKYSELIPPHVENVYDKQWRNNKNKHPTANCLELQYKFIHSFKVIWFK